MKKSVFYLLGILLALNFVACNNDDEKVVYVYDDNNMELTVNGEKVTSRIIMLEMYSDTQGAAILCSIIPDAYQQGIYVTMTQNGESKKIEGKLVHVYFELELDGTITDDILTVDIIYKNTSDLPGEWDYADTYMHIESKNDIVIDAEGNTVPTEAITEQLKQQFANYLSHLVTLDLTSGGNMNVTYLSMANEQHTLNRLAYYYTTKERVFFIPDLSFLITGKGDIKESPISYETIYLDYKLVNNELTFYIDKDALLVLKPLIRILSAVFEDKPALIEPIEFILNIASQAEVFEVGITLKR